MRVTLTKLIKIISLTIAIILAVSLIPPVITKADVIDSGTCGESLIWTLDSDGTLTISGEGKMSDFNQVLDSPWYENRTSIKSIVFNGNEITGIGNCAFWGFVSLEQITIPESVISIGEYAFFNCIDLISITIPDSVTDIGTAAFQQCKSLEDITLSDNITKINDYLFSGCTELEGITIPENVINIGNSAFTSCRNLVSITLPDSVESIGNAAFRECISLEDITIPERVTSIGHSAFFGCRNFVSITLPDSVKSIGTNAFRECISLASITISDSITSIENGTFEECISLENIIIPDKVTRIGEKAFNNCISLECMEIPESATTIGKTAFWNCYSLQSITIPASISEVGSDILGNSGIQDIYYEGAEEEWKALNIYEGPATLFSSEDFQDAILPEVTLEDIPSGIAVTIESEGSEIFYTLDGSIPCTASIPYEGTFILDEFGEYLIKARAFNLDEGQCSPVSTEYLSLEQSEKPVISERNGQITIVGDGDIYYSLNPEEEPSTLSYQYEEPLNSDEITVIKAICIEEGKVASEVAGYVRSGKSISPLNLKKDTFQFDNQKDSFGYVSSMVRPYHIPEERYYEIFGNTMGRLLYQEKGNIAWQGSCYGMSVAALLFKIGFLNISDYSDEADSVSELLKPGSPDSQLTKLIEKYQISQYLYENMEAREEHQVENSLDTDSNKQRGNDLIRAVEGAISGGDPVILILFGGSCHCVVPYRKTENRIYVYDSKYPGNDNRFISYGFNDKDALTFEYESYNKWISYDTLSGLMNGLEESLQGSIASLFGEKESRILLSLNTDDIAITDLVTGEEAEYVTYSSTDDILSGGVVVSLKTGAYRIVNNDQSLESITVTAATDDDYQTVTVHDPGAVVEVRERHGKIYICVVSENETNIEADTISEKGYKNSLSLSSDYAEIYSTTDRTVVIRTKAATAFINGKDETLISDESDTEYYLGVAASPDAEIGAALYREGEQYTLSTDIVSLPGDAFNLTVFATGGNENTLLYAASYSDTGRMVVIKGVKMTAGKTRYVFGIGKNVAEVKVFMVSTDKFKPLVNSVAVK